MLGKLLKYDFKEYKTMLPVYGLSIGLSLVALIMFKCGAVTSTNPFITIAMSLEFTATIFSLAAVLVGSFALVVINFGKQTVGVQGQIMFTLPVSIDQFLSSKIISGITIVLAGIVYLCAWIMAALAVTDGLGFVTIFFNEIGNSWIPYAVLVIVGMISSVLMYYTAVALSGRFSQNRILGSIVAYFCINFALQLFMVIVLIVFGIGFFALDSSINFMEMLNGAAIINAVFWLISVLYIAICTAFYFITRREFSKKINLP